MSLFKVALRRTRLMQLRWVTRVCFHFSKRYKSSQAVSAPRFPFLRRT